MSKKLLFFLLVAASFSAAAHAQPGGGFQRSTPEERVARIHQKLDSAFQLGAETFKVLDTALVVLYRQQDSKMRELMAGGPGSIDRETMQAEMKKFTDAQDEILKAVLSKEQYEIWKEKIQPTMRRGGRNGGGPGGPPPGGGN